MVAMRSGKGGHVLTPDVLFLLFPWQSEPLAQGTVRFVSCVGGGGGGPGGTQSWPQRVSEPGPEILLGACTPPQETSSALVGSVWSLG